MLMFLLVSFFISLVPTPAEATVETFLNGLTVKLENTVTENSLHGKNVRDITERQRRSGPSSYRPYTGDPYDVGPIGMCSYPQLDVCNFSDSYTVPEYVARTVLNYNDVLKKLKGEIRNLDGSRCAESMMNFMCKELIAPQCISSTTVRYPSNSLSVRHYGRSSCEFGLIVCYVEMPTSYIIVSEFRFILSNLLYCYSAGTTNRTLLFDTVPNPQCQRLLLYSTIARLDGSSIRTYSIIGHIS